MPLRDCGSDITSNRATSPTTPSAISSRARRQRPTSTSAHPATAYPRQIESTPWGKHSSLLLAPQHTTRSGARDLVALHLDLAIHYDEIESCAVLVRLGKGRLVLN